MTGYRFAPAARHDLIEIWLYTADRWGVDQADRYVGQIEAYIENATIRAKSGSPVIGLPGAYRKVRSGSHRVIYRLIDEELFVIRILHERQDVPDEIEDS